MSIRGDLPNNCGVCVYRRPRVDELGGPDSLSCHRHAPSPGRGDENEVITWPHVLSNQRCGAGSLGTPDATGAPRHIVPCERCLHWFSPPGGLAPDFPGEHDDSWWRGAGLCLLRAPVPGVDADGMPTEWRITHYASGCGDGQEIETIQNRTVPALDRGDN